MSLNKNRFLIVIGGPTAVGKTNLAVEIAKKYQTAIISADSRQLYTELNLGTAKPSIEEKNSVTHHFIDHISIHTPYSAGDFEREARSTIDGLLTNNRVVVVVGGSGLYINAIIHGLDEQPKIDPEIRTDLNKRLKEDGIDILLEELEKVDPEFSEIVDKNNHRRVIRALEVYYSSSIPFSKFRTRQSNKSTYTTVLIGLEMERSLLYERINLRVDQMIANGLVEEVKDLYPFRHLPALQTVGYTEIFGYIDGTYDLDEAIRLVKRNSRRYAKRQFTWFKNQEDMRWFEHDNHLQILKYLESEISTE